MTQRYFSVNQLIVVFRVIQYFYSASYTCNVINVINIHIEMYFYWVKILSEKGET